jgi:hypothetical protein
MGQQLQARQLQASQFQAWQSVNGERLWLSMLIDAMEQVSRPELRRVPCDPSILVALRAQLAQPASPPAHGVTRFSLCN